MPTKTECKNIVLSSAKKVLIAPYDATKIAAGTAEASATDIGFTNGGVTISGAVEKALIQVDQSATPIREITTAVNLNLSIPLASVTLSNLELALQVELGADGKDRVRSPGSQTGILAVLPFLAPSPDGSPVGRPG